MCLVKCKGFVMPYFIRVLATGIELHDGEGKVPFSLY
jgi:hypothetical protein